jgi:hypothetical protein
VIAVEWGTGQVVIGLLAAGIVALWIVMVIYIFRDIIRSHHLSGGAKALWAIAIIVLPFVGVLVYLMVHGDSIGARMVSDRVTH